MSTIADTPSTEEPTPRGTGDSAEADKRLEQPAEVAEVAAKVDREEADAIETLKKRSHPFD